MDALTSRKFWGSVAIVFTMLSLAMAISTFSFEFVYAQEIAAAQAEPLITVCSPVEQTSAATPLTDQRLVLTSCKSAVTTLNPDDNEAEPHDAIVVGTLPPVDTASSFVVNMPPAHPNSTLTVNTSAILIE